MNTNELNNLMNSPSKRFYLIKEIENIAQKEAKRHKDDRSIVRKIVNAMGSQETAVDAYSDLQQEVDLCKSVTDPLEKASVLVKALIVTNKCQLIISFKDPQYRRAYKQFKHDYHRCVQKFVELQYRTSLDKILINHLRDALNVLVEKGDITAENRIKELPEYELLIEIYRKLEVKLKSLLHDFSKELLQECKELLLQFKNSSLAKKIKDEIVETLQLLYNRIIFKSKQAIENEISNINPSITAITKAIENYLEMKEAFAGIGLELGSNSYDDLYNDLLSLQSRVTKEYHRIKELLQNLKEGKQALEENILAHYLVLKELTTFLSEFDFSYAEVGDILTEVEAGMQELINSIEQVKKKHIEDLHKQLNNLNKSSISKTTATWVDLRSIVEEELISFEKEGIKYPELNTFVNELNSFLITYVDELIDEYSFESHISKEYKAMLTELIDKLGILVDIDLDLPMKLSELNNLISKLSKCEELIDNYESSSNSGIGKKNIVYLNNNLEEVIKAYKNSDIIKLLDINPLFLRISSFHQALQSKVQDYYKENAWVGNLVLRNPKFNVNIVLLNDSRVFLGRAGQEWDLIKGNRIYIPWARISANHLLLDFEKGIIEDVASSNGSYINKKTSSITCEMMKDVSEFNLASDMTFQLFYQPQVFSGFVFKSFSTPHSKVFHVSSKDELFNILSTCYFIYLPQDLPEAELIIRKYDGKAIYGNEVLDYNDCYVITRRNNIFYYSDKASGISNLPILKNDNERMKLLVSARIM